MKQLLFLVISSFLGITGSFVITPLWGIAVYYMYAVLRPQFIWEWVPDTMGIKIQDVQWSFFIAIGTLLATGLWRIGLLYPSAAIKTPWYGRPGFTRTHYLFFAFVFWISVTFVTAISHEQAFQPFVEYIKIFLMFICATQILRTIRELWVIYFVVLGSAVYAAYEINLYYFVDVVMYLQQRGYGGLDNNGAALIVAMAVPLAYFAWEASRHWTRWGFLMVIPVLVHALMLSFSRGGMLSLIVAGGPIWLRTRHKVFLSIVYFVLGLFVLATAGKELQERFFSISKQDADESAQSRWTTWSIAIRMANERPLFGMGIRNSNLFTFKYGADIEGRSIHSQYLQTAADSGWVGLALYLGLLGSMFMGLREVRRFLRKYNDVESQKVKSMAAGLECALLLFCFGAIFLSLEHFEMPYILILLAVQLHAITRNVAARYAAAAPPTARALPPPPSPLPATSVAR
jgi:probable O-glycosylation ligase (exosortase A-associated)